MSNEETTAAQLPDYITSATPNPAENRAPWYKNTAPTYAGVFLWFVFWQDAATAPSLGGVLAGGVAWALASWRHSSATSSSTWFRACWDRRRACRSTSWGPRPTGPRAGS